MSRNLAQELLRPARLLRDDDTVAVGARALLEGDLRALPVVDAREHLSGVFGEREFLSALFPRYVGELHNAAFITAALDDTIERRLSCAGEAVGNFLNKQHVDVPRDASDLDLAETFLHNRVLIVPVLEDRRVVGVIDRRDFFTALAGAFVSRVSQG